MSANTVVDLANTCDYRASLSINSGGVTFVGEIVDLLHADNNCNVWVVSNPIITGGAGGSGVIQIQVQTSDSTTSGTFTDPTSGLPSSVFPVGGPYGFASGGILNVNSGLWASGNSSLSAPISGAPLFCSGGIQLGSFQRPQRYARLLNLSGPYASPIAAGFISQKRTTASGPGFSYSPGSGSINV